MPKGSVKVYITTDTDWPYKVFWWVKISSKKRNQRTDYTVGAFDFSDPRGEIRFRNDCKIQMKDNSVETLVPFTQTSDGRTKTNKEEIRSGLDAILRLKPQTYEKNGKTESGFITQEVLGIPELAHLVNVPENKDEYQSLNYIGLIALFLPSRN